MNTEVTIDMQRASQLLKLLGDQTRLTMMKLLQSHVMKLLQSHDCCVCEFVEIFKMSQPAISQHLRKLRDIELVKEERKGQWIFFSINENHDDFRFIQSILEQLPEQNESIAELEAQGLRISCN
ncbi:ArsR family transcriptional regulator [Lederbergia galactosidilytica]|uniref:ArsR family transcriptional regulator n=1 Tax=Lederbergia galactosidilytica TaxID=217031 RepID=A0A0Q9XXV1_9BACI|nr:ArsR family transcriptional regulator [Lederbergia galactosidilytica]